MTKQITFSDEHQTKVKNLFHKYASRYEHLASSKDGMIYEVSFTSPENYQNFFVEFAEIQVGVK